MSLLLLFSSLEIATQTFTLVSSTLFPGLGDTVTVTATLLDRDGSPLVGKTIYFTVTGANTASGTDTTDASGEATFQYVVTNTGTDTAFAQWGDSDGLDLLLSNVGSPQVYRFPGFSDTPSEQFGPSVELFGIAFDGDNLIATDGTNIIRYDGFSSTVTDTIVGPTTNLLAVGWAAGNLVSASALENIIYIHDGFSTTILTSFPPPEGEVRGIGFDGTNLLIAIHTADKVYRMVGISSVVDTSVTLTGLSVLQSVAWDGANLIVVEGGTIAGDREVRLYDGFSDSLVDSFITPNSTVATPHGVDWTATLNDSITLSVALRGSGVLGRRTARLVP